MAAENGFKQVENCYVSSGQVLKLFQPSYTLYKSGHCYCPRLASNACHFDLQVDNTTIEQLLH